MPDDGGVNSKISTNSLNVFITPRLLFVVLPPMSYVNLSYYHKLF